MLVPVIAYIMVTMAMGCGTNLKTTNYPGMSAANLTAEPAGSGGDLFPGSCSGGALLVSVWWGGALLVSVWCLLSTVQFNTGAGRQWRGICFPVHVLVVLYWCRCGGVVLYWCRGGGQQDWQADRGGQSHNRHTPYNRQGAGGYGGTGGDYTKRR
uniref:Uncharacterized protein n=1 Tax=Timema douglasi TaxID=61478 RepID=A0A7R8VM50_TIMDO|nr:unnamed protein product [Timema douglasi]